MLTTVLSENTVAESGQRLTGFVTQVKCLVDEYYVKGVFLKTKLFLF